MSKSEFVRAVTQRLLAKSGRGYTISDEIPTSVLSGELVARGFQLLRGLFRFRKYVFLGRRLRIRGRAGLKMGRGVFIGDDSSIDARGRLGIQMAPGSRLGRRGMITTTSHLSFYGEGLRLGAGSGVGDFFHIGASGGVHVGKDVIIGPYFLVHSQEHNFDDPTRAIKAQGTTQSPVRIGDDCWIGSRVTLLAGAELGPRTIVASGAVVKGHHPGNEILAGIPAKRIKAL
jgi:acetyltransferase-like isoleucine patch superfamily enzyme